MVRSRSRAVFILFVIVLFFVCWAPLGLALQRAIELMAPPMRSVFPGEIATLVFLASNRGALDDTYDFRAETAPGMQLVSAIPPAAIAASGQEPIFVSVFILPDAPAGDYIVRLEAISRSDSSVKASARAQLTVQAVTGVEVRAPLGLEVELGNEALLSYTVTNRGNIIDTFRLEAISRRAFPTSVDPPVVALLPGASRSVIVSVRVPVDAASGLEAVTLVASSLSRPGVGGSSTAVLTILPPLPEKIPTALFLKSPAELGFTLNFDPSTDSLTPQLSFLTEAVLPEQLSFSLRTKISALADTLGENIQEFAFISQFGLYGLGLRVGDLARLPLEEVALPTRGIELSIVNLLALTLTLDAPEERAYGISFFGPLGTQAGFARLVIDDSLSSHDVVGARFAGLGLEVEGAFDRASTPILRLFTARVAPQWEDFTLGFTLTRIDPGFPSLQTADIQAWSLFGSASIGAFLPGALISGAHTDTFDDPLVQRLRTFTFQMTLTIDDLYPGLPTALFELRGVAQRSSEPPPLSLDESSITAIFFNTTGPIVYSFTFIHTAFSDNIASSATYTDQWSTYLLARRLLGIEGLAGGVRASENLKTDGGSGAILEQSLSVRASFSFSIAGFSASLEFGLDNALPAMASAIFLSRGMFDFSLSTSFRAPSAIGINAEVRTRFALPLESVLVKGRVEGFIFIDQNGNAQRDANEPGVPGALLRIEDQLARTDERGFFRFAPSDPGAYRLDIARLPVGLIPRIALPIPITVAVGQVTLVAIPVRTVAILSGRVFNDANRNGRPDLGEAGIAGVRVFAAGTSPVQARTNSEGQYALQVDPGTHTVSLDLTTLPSRFAVTTPAAVTVAVQTGQRALIDFGIAETVRPILVAPAADFTFTPAAPQVGERVIFDASASQAVDARSSCTNGTSMVTDGAMRPAASSSISSAPREDSLSSSR